MAYSNPFPVPAPQCDGQTLLPATSHDEAAIFICLKVRTVVTLPIRKRAEGFEVGWRKFPTEWRVVVRQRMDAFHLSGGHDSSQCKTKCNRWVVWISWHTPIISLLGSWSQEDQNFMIIFNSTASWECSGSLGYMELCLRQQTTWDEKAVTQVQCKESCLSLCYQLVTA